MTAKCFVPVGKVRDYLLDPDHEDGGPKSAFFAAHGFDRASYEQLSQALAQHFENNQPSQTIETTFGRKYVIRGQLHTPDGRNPMIQSVWIVSSAAALTRAEPSARGHHPRMFRDAAAS